MQQKTQTINEGVLVSITVSKKKQKVAYKVHCSKQVNNDELAHYLDEIIEGICTWKPEICEDTFYTIAQPITNQSKPWQRKQVNQTTLF